MCTEPFSEFFTEQNNFLSCSSQILGKLCRPTWKRNYYKFLESFIISETRKMIYQIQQTQISRFENYVNIEELMPFLETCCYILTTVMESLIPVNIVQMFNLLSYLNVMLNSPLFFVTDDSPCREKAKRKESLNAVFAWRHEIVTEVVWSAQ